MSISLPNLRDRDRILIVEAGRLHPAVSFSRSSIATYLNGTGTLVTAATNIPRFEYSQSGTYLGLLIEEQRTNRALQSRDMTNAAWVKTNITTAQTQTGLDGVANSATQLTSTAANGTSLQTITDATSRSRGVSFDIKRVSGTGNIDITGDNGTTWTTVSGLSSSVFTRYFVNVTNANPVIGVRIVASGDVVIVDFAQCEDGASATSRIATTTATVTRAADLPTVTALSAIGFNPNEGMFVCKVRHGAWAATQQTYFILNDGTTNNRIQVRRETASTTTLALILTGGVSQASFNQASGGDSTVNKIVMGYKLNDIAGSCNGIAVSTDISATIPAVDRMQLGYNISGDSLNGYIEYLAYYPKKRANVEYPRLST